MVEQLLVISCNVTDVDDVIVGIDVSEDSGEDDVDENGDWLDLRSIALAKNAPEFDLSRPNEQLLGGTATPTTVCRRFSRRLPYLISPRRSVLGCTPLANFDINEETVPLRLRKNSISEYPACIMDYFSNLSLLYNPIIFLSKNIYFFFAAQLDRCNRLLNWLCEFD